MSILPKGLVVNSLEIEGSIQSIDALDLADIAKLWKVYTTTKRRLLDPTAERQENYWWRTWGSGNRELKGATIARQFTNISNGQSFVPLRGPANRDGGTPQSGKTIHYAPRTASVTTLHHSSQSRPSTTSSSATPKAPVMPHSILKKTTPSTNGPRPTARFISPNESEDEADPNSHISPNIVVQPPLPNSQNSKTDEKAIVPRAKKKPQGFVDSTAAKKEPDMGAIRLTYNAKSSTNAAPMSAGMDKEKGRDPEEADMFHKRPVPQILEAATAAFPEGSLANRKSQLTLLLEKDRARFAKHRNGDEEKEQTKIYRWDGN